MKIAFCADIHIGNHQQFGGALKTGMNDRCRLVIDTLKRAYRVAVQNGCEGFYILGDLFDTEKPTPQMLAAVQEIFGPHNEDVGAIVGNHDQHSYTATDHALAPLSDHIEVFEKAGVLFIDHTAKTSLWMVPYEPGPAVDWLPKRLAECTLHEKEASFRPSRRLLAIHLGIQDAKTESFMRGHDDAISADALHILMERHDIHHTFAGNWHNARQWSFNDGKAITQVGTLAPVGFRDQGLAELGEVAIYNTKAHAVKRLPIAGPRFVKVKIAEDETWKAMTKRLPRPQHAQIAYLEVKVPPARYRALAAEALKGTKDWPHIRVVPDDAEIQKQAQQAASAAKNAANKGAAVAAFVDRMPLDKGVSRENVKNHCRRYLHGRDMEKAHSRNDASCSEARP